MKKLSLFLALIFVSLPVYAEQIKIWESDTSEHFIKSDTVKYKGKLATFWLLTNNYYQMNQVIYLINKKLKLTVIMIN